jgi:hypothetical protein
MQKWFLQVAWCTSYTVVCVISVEQFCLLGCGIISVFEYSVVSCNYVYLIGIVRIENLYRSCDDGNKYN